MTRSRAQSVARGELQPAPTTSRQVNRVNVEEKEVLVEEPVALGASSGTEQPDLPLSSPSQSRLLVSIPMGDSKRKLNNTAEQPHSSPQKHRRISQGKEQYQPPEPQSPSQSHEQQAEAQIKLDQIQGAISEEDKADSTAATVPPYSQPDQIQGVVSEGGKADSTAATVPPHSQPDQIQGVISEGGKADSTAATVPPHSQPDQTQEVVSEGGKAYSTAATVPSHSQPDHDEHFQELQEVSYAASISQQKESHDITTSRESAEAPHTPMQDGDATKEPSLDNREGGERGDDSRSKTNIPEAASNTKDNWDDQHRRKRARTNDKAEGDGIQDDDEDSDPEEDEENQVVPEYVLREMQAFEQGFNGLQGKFKLLDKIGAGTFSSVYKAIDLEHEQYDNTAWDYQMEKLPDADVSEDKSTTTKLSDSEGGKVVALKRIYVTSSPDRIQNEIAILHDLSGHKNVVPLITAFRFMDQVIVVLPYFEHRDFREYYKTLPMDGIRCYFRALLKALMHVHASGIIHRDVKPSNFLYDVQRKTGMLVDFGLAQRQESSRKSYRESKSRSSSLRASAAERTSAVASAASAAVRPSTSTSAATAPTRISTSSTNAGARASTPNPTGPTTSTAGVATTGTQAQAAHSFLAQRSGSTRRDKENDAPVSSRSMLESRATPRTSHASMAVTGAPTQPTATSYVSSSTVPTPARNQVHSVRHTTTTQDFAATLQNPFQRQRPGAHAASISATVANNPSPMPSHSTHGRSKHPSHLPHSETSSIPPIGPVPKATRALGFDKKDPRPVIRVNRAGTRGFRAPEILFRHVQQTVGRFPFFHSDDDLEALLEIAVVFGQREMAAVAATFKHSSSRNLDAQATPASDAHGQSVTFQAHDPTIVASKMDLQYRSGTHKQDGLPEPDNRRRAHNDLMTRGKDRKAETTPTATSATAATQPDVEATSTNPDPKSGTSSATNGTRKLTIHEIETAYIKSLNIVGTENDEDFMDAIDLLDKLLALDPTKRITARQALKHRFLAEDKPMKRTSTHLWIQLVLFLVLTIINVPPWLMFKGNTIASVCALDVSFGGEGNEPNVVVVETLTQGQDGEHDERTREGQAHVQGFQQQQRPLGFVKSDPSLDSIPMSSLQGSIVVADPQLDSQSRSGGDMEKEAKDAQQTPLEAPSPQNPDTSSLDDLVAPVTEPPTTGSTHPIRRLINTYYVRLSALPGTEEAKAQHALVRNALLALPGKVTIRQEFGRDEDDVLNVISFKLEGCSDELEEVAALPGVIGIYPVHTRKRPKALPLGSLQRTRPSLESAHILTGIQMVHQKLGLTGKGIKVGIIDTGVDYKHPALGGCFGPGCKVAYGYDFVGDDYDNGDSEKDTPKPDKDPMDCAGHGTHVAGIVAARNEGPNAMGPQNFVGVAPDATIGAYRVFGCDGEVSDDVLLAALKRAYRDGMDIVNLSLGGSSGWPEEPFATACSSYIKKGLHIAIANGNDGEEGLFEDGAPATAAGAVAVGSVDNTHFLGPAADVVWQSLDRNGKEVSAVAGRVDGAAAGGGVVGRIGMALGADAADVPLVAFRSDLTYVIYAPSKDPQGCAPYDEAALDRDNQVPRPNIVVLLRRGGCTFSDKAKLIANAKLGGLLVYDIIPEQRPLGMAVSGFNISAAGLSFEDATVLMNALKAKETNPTLRNSGRKLTARFSSTDQILKLASGGKISDFSSWGPDARLQYKPDIVAPGGMIYSTFPLAKGGFATLQGTSMASPYMAGIQALFLSKYGKTEPALLLRILQSTAVVTVKPGSSEGLTSVFQQGGGLVSMERLFAQELPTIVSPTALYLNDTQFQKLDHDITFVNPSASSGRTWTLVHRPAVSVNGFEDSNHYSPVNQSRLRHSDISAGSASMTPAQFQLGPGATGTFRVRIDPPTGLDIKERWLFSGFLEFQCRTTQGASCGSSLVSYGGMHGHLGDIPILNPALIYPALQLDRLLNADGASRTTSSSTPDNDNDDEHHVHSDTGRTPSGHKKKGGDNTKRKEQKNLFRDQSELVQVGKGDQDWVQILVSINFPTSLLTIEAESVCDNDHGAGSSGDRIRLEIGGSGRSRFQIETEEDLEVAENMVARVELHTGDEDELPEDMDLGLVAHMKERLARSRELAFMPSGLYMPYEGYSRVMAPNVPIEPLSLLRKSHKHGKKSKGKAESKFGKKKSKKAHKSKSIKKSSSKHQRHYRQGAKSTSGDKKGRRNENDRKNKNKNRHHRDKENGEITTPHHKKQGGGSDRSRGRRRPASASARPSRLSPPSQIRSPTCVPRILGLIPNGFNPWSTRTDSTEGNAFQTFSWMGDLLLQNHDANSEPQCGADGLDTGEDTESLVKDVDGGKGDKKKKKRKGKGKRPRPDQNMAEGAQPDLTRDLPDGQYRLVVKVLKPWGVRGRAIDVERWSSPIIVIKRRK
ncbi:hypothetical protein KI688_003792 [Linnemannia hyalina]|uniref:Protein kinase domain-containing protein n=1 Tax=Linnemannia hyalina TaxID=64524 RepID=A0A9P7XMA9_9FUNG|nr:hypothetical protein KI688_003792 [Linnemannia hyalina]